MEICHVVLQVLYSIFKSGTFHCILRFLISVIPVFGVLTQKDRINEEDKDYQALEKDFREGLGLPYNRFLLCTTYCDDYDMHHGKSRLDQRHPELDIPILKFMRQVHIKTNSLDTCCFMFVNICVA